MKMTITPEDVCMLNGKFIIQLDSDNSNVILSDKNWSFYREKRISFICGNMWCGFAYLHQNFSTVEEFVEYFNDYVNAKHNESKGQRFHRLLTSEELDFVCRKMKEFQW